MKFLSLSISILWLALAGPSAPKTPSFKGTWLLSVLKSDFSPANHPKKMTLKIKQDRAGMRVSTELTDGLAYHSFNATYTFDGAENENLQDGITVKSSREWDGVKLDFSVKRGMTLQFKEAWALSSDGKTLTIYRHTIFADGEVNEKYVFEEQ
ncbi:MAG TPA: hypothetical protein VJN21_04570 [Candidatus Acidoferrales bacterium]|nr:hypothetical protein [Candidatus Acidoferrales bacterium]